MKRKIIALLMLCAMLMAVMIGCTAEDGSDLEYVLAKEKLVVGITYYAPIDFKDDNGTLIGFDHDLAEAVCQKLGVTAVFQEIDWNTKENELNSKTIDVIWNGMTITDELKESIAISAP